MAPLAGALLVAPENLFMEQQDREALLDAWWTLIVYHGSLNGVGISHNAFSTDVPDYMARYKGAWENEYPLEGANRDESKYTERSLNVAELTSVPGPEENSRTFDRLEKRRSDVECLDAVLATNMISVGLDVARMALMIINGQPLTTAEYIQASSRVGRGDVPGLVIANYYRDQARSLSHYESFRPYHESFYRFVEPSSVTPYTYQTRLRALHAALVIAIRHACPRLADNNKPGEFDPETPDVKKIIAELTRRCIVADQDRAGEIAKHLHQIAAQWQEEAIRCRENKVQLVYQSSDRNRGPARLLYNHEARIKGLWPTLQSMRHVENTTLLKPL